jgi:hypothetical protein
MSKPNRSRAKSIAVDIVGVLLIIAAALTGWLPGPGGIPLLILGLSLLATNHEWAERWMNKIKASGGKFSEKFFNGHPLTKLAVDLGGVLLIAGAVLLLTMFTASVARSAAISLLALSLFLLLANRSRFQQLKKRFKR